LLLPFLMLDFCWEIRLLVISIGGGSSIHSLLGSGLACMRCFCPSVWWCHFLTFSKGKWILGLHSVVLPHIRGENILSGRTHHKDMNWALAICESQLNHLDLVYCKLLGSSCEFAFVPHDLTRSTIQPNFHSQPCW
jgi:hypothetical protein